MSTKLSEQEHQNYLKLFLEEARELKRERQGKLISMIAPYAQDNLEIAKDVGYDGLYKEFMPLYQEVGLIK
jgi:hypothetical protein